MALYSLRPLVAVSTAYFMSYVSNRIAELAHCGVSIADTATYVLIEVKPYSCIWGVLSSNLGPVTSYPNIVSCSISHEALNSGARRDGRYNNM
jgi:hypothetical protein